MNHDQFEEVAAEYLLAIERGTPDALHVLCAQHPQYEDRLMRFALLDAAIPSELAAEELDAVRPLATPALQAAVRTAVDGLVQPVLIGGIFARAARIGMNARQLAARLNLPRDLLLSLDNRAVAVSTVPGKCLEALADALQTGTDNLRAYLSGSLQGQSGGDPQRSAVPAFSYAPAPPVASGQQTFLEALAQSGLSTPEQQAYWLQVAREEGLAD